MQYIDFFGIHHSINPQLQAYGPISILWPPKQKKNKNNKFKKKWARKVSQSLKNKLFSKNFTILNYFFNSNGFFLQFNSNKSTNMNKYIKTTKIFRKPVVSNDMKFHSLQRKLINTQTYASMRQLGSFIISYQ